MNVFYSFEIFALPRCSAVVLHGEVGAPLIFFYYYSFITGVLSARFIASPLSGGHARFPGKKP